MAPAEEDCTAIEDEQLKLDCLMRQKEKLDLMKEVQKIDQAHQQKLEEATAAP